MSVLTAEYL